VATSLFAQGAHDRSRIGRDVRRSLTVIGLILVPTAIVAALFGEQLLALLGPAYTEGSTLLVLLAVGAFPDAVSNVYVAVLRLERRFRAATALTGSMAALTIALTVLMIGPYGLNGVGLAFIASQSIGCLLVAADVLVQRHRVKRVVHG